MLNKLDDFDSASLDEEIDTELKNLLKFQKDMRWRFMSWIVMLNTIIKHIKKGMRMQFQKTRKNIDL